MEREPQTAFGPCTTIDYLASPLNTVQVRYFDVLRRHL
jgi:hypothetical protein